MISPNDVTCVSECWDFPSTPPLLDWFKKIWSVELLTKMMIFNHFILFIHLRHFKPVFLQRRAEGSLQYLKSLYFRPTAQYPKTKGQLTNRCPLKANILLKISHQLLNPSWTTLLYIVSTRIAKWIASWHLQDGHSTMLKTAQRISWTLSNSL